MRTTTSLIALFLGLGIFAVAPVATKMEPFAAKAYADSHHSGGKSDHDGGKYGWHDHDDDDDDDDDTWDDDSLDDDSIGQSGTAAKKGAKILKKKRAKRVTRNASRSRNN